MDGLGDLHGKLARRNQNQAPNDAIVVVGRADPMEQRQRDAVMKRFRASGTDLLVATDVAARGLDIEQISHVVNYDLPSSSEAYVHRIGRTGRAGRGGTAITLLEPREHRLLKSIEHAVKQKIDVCPVPTVADLHAKRLELTRASLRERVLAGGFDDVKVVIESLAEEFDVIDVAAAAVAMAHAAVGRDGEDEADIPAVASVPPKKGARREAPGERRPRDEKRDHDDRRRDQQMVRLFVGAGRSAGIRPADLVGAIANEAGVRSKDLGGIEIGERFSLVEVPESLADGIVDAMRRSTLRGKKVPIRRDREA
jgi:ATP-dependent RNA helicase DeaD